MQFDTADYLDAISPPVLVHRGRRHIGRVLSWKEWIASVPDLDRLQSGELSLQEADATMRRVIDALFPPPPPDAYARGPWYAPWRRRPVRSAPTAADDFADLPLPAQLELLQAFLKDQGDALTLKKSKSASASGPEPRPLSGPIPTSPTS